MPARLRRKYALLCSDIIAKTGKTPVLATILVGNNPASVTYVRMKATPAPAWECSPARWSCPKAHLTTQELLEVINTLTAIPRCAEYCFSILFPPI